VGYSASISTWIVKSSINLDNPGPGCFVYSSDVNLSDQRNKRRRKLIATIAGGYLDHCSTYERPCYITSSVALESYCTARNRYQLEGPRQAHALCEESDRIGAHRTIRHGCPRRSWDLNLSGRATLRVNHNMPHTPRPAAMQSADCTYTGSPRCGDVKTSSTVVKGQHVEPGAVQLGLFYRDRKREREK
jgi:hypothetical protein